VRATALTQWRGVPCAWLAALTLAAAVLAACTTDPTTTVTPTVTANAHAWSGESFVLRSRSFVGPDSLPTVTIGPRILTVQSFGGDSVVVQLPDTNGAVSLLVALRSSPRALPLSVVVHGYRGIADGPRVDGDPYPWPGGGAPTALAFQDGRLVLLDYRTNSAGPLTADTNLGSPCNSQPVPSALAGLVVVAPRSGNVCGQVVAVPVTSGAGPADTGWALGTYRPTAHLGVRAWLIGDPGYLDWRRPGDSGFLMLNCEAGRMVMSPRGDRVVPLCYGSAPVVDTRSPGVAYSVTTFRWLDAAEFTAGGDTLFLAGGDSAGTAMVLAVDALTGREIARAQSGAGESTALAADPIRPWLYVWSLRPGPVWYVDVLDRGTLSHVAALRVPSPAVAAGPAAAFATGYWTLILSPVERVLYATLDNEAAASAQAAKPTWVLKFDLMP
jgi:hypothetical protein